jgi:hypothetical protein
MVSVLVEGRAERNPHWASALGSWAFGREPGNSMRAWPWVFVVAPLSGLVICWALRSGKGIARAIALAALGLAMHWTVHLLEGRGMQPFYDKLWRVGHTEFIRIAMEDRNLKSLVPRYEEMARERGWVFPRSKPPGCLFTYRGLVALADGPLGILLASALAPSGTQANRMERVTATLIAVFSLLAYVTAIVLFLFVRRLWGDSLAVVSVFVFVTTPAVSIVAMHLDNALYPLVGISTLLLIGTGRRALVVGAGALLSMGLFVSFSLLPIIPLAAALPFMIQISPDPPSRSDSLIGRIWRRLAGPALNTALFCVSLAAVHGVLIWLMRYDVVARYRGAQAFHDSWWSGGGKDWRIGNAIQFAVWLGAPFAVALFLQAVTAARSAVRQRPSSLELYSLLALAVFVALDLSATSKSEVMRLWSAMIPPMSIVAATSLNRWSELAGRWFLPVLGVWQVAYTVLLHAFRTP